MGNKHTPHERRARAKRLLKAVERFIRAENAHRRRGRSEELRAGRPLQSTDLTTTSRDEVDWAHADLVGDFTTEDCRDARRLLSAKAEPLLSK